MESESRKPKLEADYGSVKWITPWGNCTALVDSDGDVTLSTSILPCPVFTENEWLRFCEAVNKNITKIKDKDVIPT